MVLSFPAWRRGEVRLCGGLIDEALLRGHTVNLCWKPETKPGESVTIDALQSRWPKARIVTYPLTGLGTVLAPVTYALTGLGTVLAPLAALRDDPADVSLDYCLNHLHCRPPRNVKLMTFYSSWEMSKWLEAAVFRWKTSPACQTVVTGAPELDGLRLCEPNDTRFRYALGRMPVVLVFALKFVLPGNLWRRYVYRHLGYRQTFKALRRFCDRLGALLVVKTRAKHDDPAWIHQYADRVIGDEDLYPSTAHQLLSVASLAVHWQSGACYEAAAVRVPQISIRIPHPHLDAYSASRFLFGMHVSENTPNRWSGLVHSFRWQDAPDYFHNAATMPFVSPAAHAAYLTKFLGAEPLGASARVLDAVEALNP